MSWFDFFNPYRPPQADLTGPHEPRKWTREEIYETVADVLVEALGVDRDEIHPQASIVRDLGGE